MFDKKRILVVEDEEDLRVPYKRSLERRGFSVDEAIDLDTALSLINMKTYHVAFVDLMLGGRGVFNMDGLKILQQLHELDEGTITIVLSSQTDTQISADTLQEYGATRYIKKDIISDDLGKLGEVVQQAVEKCQLLTFGKEAKGREGVERSALVFIAGGVGNEKYFVDKCLRVFKPKGGYNELEAFVHSFLVRLTPLMPPTDHPSEYYIFDESAGLLHGSFWSKAIGKPIFLVIGNQNKQEDLLAGKVKPHWREEEEIREARYEHRNLCGLVFKLHDLERSAFLRKIS